MLHCAADRLTRRLELTVAPLHTSSPIVVSLPTSGSCTAARQVSVCLVSKSDADDQQKMLNVEAKPFIPESLKTLFDAAPSAFMSGVGFQDALLDKG